MRRVVVIGCIGGGKSTLARELGKRLSLPVIHLDRLWWDDDAYRITGAATVAGHTVPAAEFRRLQIELASDDAWVVDGGYLDDLDIRLCRADTVVFLDLPRRVCLWRLVRRHNRRRPDFPGDVREGLGWFVLLARWIWRYPNEKRLIIEQAITLHCRADATVVRLRQPSDVDDFVASIRPRD